MAVKKQWWIQKLSRISRTPLESTMWLRKSFFFLPPPSPIQIAPLKSEDLLRHNNPVCKTKLLDECGKAAAERLCAGQTAAGLACSCAARCFHKGQGSEAPWQIHRCNWKRLALCVSLRPQCFCLHVQRDSDLYAHLKSSHSISWPDVAGLLFTLIYWLPETVGEGSGCLSAQEDHPHLVKKWYQREIKKKRERTVSGAKEKTRRNTVTVVCVVFANFRKCYLCVMVS